MTRINLLDIILDAGTWDTKIFSLHALEAPECLLLDQFGGTHLEGRGTGNVGVNHLHSYKLIHQVARQK